MKLPSWRAWSLVQTANQSSNTGPGLFGLWRPGQPTNPATGNDRGDRPEAKRGSMGGDRGERDPNQGQGDKGRPQHKLLQPMEKGKAWVREKG